LIRCSWSVVLAGVDDGADKKPASGGFRPRVVTHTGRKNLRRRRDVVRRLLDGAPDLVALPINAGLGGEPEFGIAIAGRAGDAPEFARAGRNFLAGRTLVWPICFHDKLGEAKFYAAA
jgi:ribosomal protein L34